LAFSVVIARPRQGSLFATSSEHGLHPLQHTHQAFRRFDRQGTYRDTYSHVLNKFTIDTFPVSGSDNVANWIKQTSELKPAIVDVDWVGGGGHAVIAVGVDNGKNVVILDPGAEAQAQPLVLRIPLGKLPEYRLRYAGDTADSVGDMVRMLRTASGFRR
jgi:hypothetical protein